MTRLDKQLATRWIRSRLPPATMRRRLTALYGGLFLASGAALLTITYFLVAHQYSTGFFIASGKNGFIAAMVHVGKAKAGVIAVTGGHGQLPTPAPGIVPGPTPQQVIAAANAQASAARTQLLIDSGIALAIMAVSRSGSAG